MSSVRRSPPASSCKEVSLPEHIHSVLRSSRTNRPLGTADTTQLVHHNLTAKLIVFMLHSCMQAYVHSPDQPLPVFTPCTHFSAIHFRDSRAFFRSSQASLRGHTKYSVSGLVCPCAHSSRKEWVGVRGHAGLQAIGPENGMGCLCADKCTAAAAAGAAAAAAGAAAVFSVKNQYGGGMLRRIV